MRVDYHQIIVAAVEDIFATMLMIDVAAGAAGQDSAVQLPGGVSGMLGFSGDISGMLSLHCPAPVATGITAAFLGMDVDEINDDVKDAVGELVNMVTGGLKDALGRHGQEIKLAIPTTIAGRAFRISSKSDVGRVYVPFELDSGTFHIEMKYK